MCSGCSGHYENDGDDWEASSPSSRDNIDHHLFQQDDSIEELAEGAGVRRRAREDSGYAQAVGQSFAGFAYEVLVSADEIIEIRRITSDLNGFAATGDSTRVTAGAEGRAAFRERFQGESAKRYGTRSNKRETFEIVDNRPGNKDLGARPLSCVWLRRFWSHLSAGWILLKYGGSISGNCNDVRKHNTTRRRG